MAARAIFKGAIQFDGVNLPVKLYTAIREEQVSFNLLHDQDEIISKKHVGYFMSTPCSMWFPIGLLRLEF